MRKLFTAFKTPNQSGFKLLKTISNLSFIDTYKKDFRLIIRNFAPCSNQLTASTVKSL